MVGIYAEVIHLMQDFYSFDRYLSAHGEESHIDRCLKAPAGLSGENRSIRDDRLGTIEIISRCN